MNPGGIRSDVDAGVITHGEAFGVQPFSNILMTQRLHRCQIDAILEQQFVNPNGSARTLILAVSKELHYTWDSAAADRQQDRPGDHHASDGAGDRSCRARTR